MAEIVNLNRRRKAAARAAEAKQAAANRVKFGRNAAEKARDAEAEARRRALLDGARMETPGKAAAGAPEEMPEGMPGKAPGDTPEKGGPG